MMARIIPLAFATSLLAGAAFGQVAIVTPETTGTISVTAHNESQFATGFRLKADHARIDDADLRSHLRDLPLAATGGEAVAGFDFDREEDLVVGAGMRTGAHVIDGLRLLLYAHEGKKRKRREARRRAPLLKGRCRGGRL